MTEGQHRRRIREVVERPGLRAQIAADLNVVVSSGGASSASQSVHVRQRSARTAGPAQPEPPATANDDTTEEQS